MRDDFSLKIKETMAKRVGMLCSNPGCRKLTSGPRDDPAKALNLGVAAHITAASANGPRFDSTLTPQERKSHANALWLCQFCAKLIDNDEKHYDVAVLKKWKTLAEESARLSVEGGASSPLAKVSDFDLIKFYAQCLNRPAFQDPFQREGSIEAFDKAIEDTITAINTGCSRLRDGQLVMQTQGIMFLGNLVWRQRMEVIVDLLRWIRSHFAEAVARKAINIQSSSGGKVFYDVRDPSLCEWMDTMRGQVLLLFAEVCKDAGVAPPAIRFFVGVGHPPMHPASQPPPVTPPPAPTSQKSEEHLIEGLLHELRSPLVAIRSAADLIRSGRRPDMIVRFAEDIEGYSALMHRMLENARFFSRGKPVFDFQRCLFRSEIYMPVLKHIEPLLRDRGFKGSQIHSPGFDTMPALWLDRVLFSQVLFNLLSNAIRFATASPTEFKIVVRASWGSEGCKISVCDWGLGVEPTESDRVFEGGYRSTRSRFLEIRGQGLGLMIARQIIEAHGGTLNLTGFQSPTEFTIWLPPSLAVRAPVQKNT
jgi:hypothetical protein